MKTERYPHLAVNSSNVSSSWASEYDLVPPMARVGVVMVVFRSAEVVGRMVRSMVVAGLLTAARNMVGSTIWWCGFLVELASTSRSKLRRCWSDGGFRSIGGSTKYSSCCCCCWIFDFEEMMEFWGGERLELNDDLTLVFPFGLIGWDTVCLSVCLSYLHKASCGCQTKTNQI